MHSCARWALLLGMTATAACFSEVAPETMDDDASPSTSDGPTGGATTTTTTATSTASTTATSTEPTSTTMVDPTADTTGDPPSCDDNVADPPEAVCARPGWSLEYGGAIASLEKADFDGGADDLLVAVAEASPELGWVLGGATPINDAVAGTHPGTRQVVRPVDDEPGDDVILVGTLMNVSDLRVYSWNGAALVSVTERDPLPDDLFVAATGTPGLEPQIAWLTESGRVDLAPLSDLGSAMEVRVLTGKGIDVSIGTNGGGELLFGCAQTGFETMDIAPGASVIHSILLSSGGAIACDVIDINDDGNSDVAHLIGDERQLITVIGSDTAFEEVGKAELEGPPLEMAHGDLDGDGDLDFVVRLMGRDFLRIIWSTDGGVPEVGPALQLPAVPTAVAAGDFDGDGDTDVAYAIGPELHLLALGFDD